MYTIVWRFEVIPEAIAAFEAMYGPEGEWVRLFRTGPGYLGTELFRHTIDDARYVAVDRWESREAFDMFRARNLHAYAELDARCERYTSSETMLGETEE
jgi:heme-degrading monooxygenase HmoA